MIPQIFTENQMVELRENATYLKAGGDCPTCESTGSYAYKGVTYECPTDHFGHVQDRLFRFYLLNGVPDEFMRLDWSEYPHHHVKEGIDLYLEDVRRQVMLGMGVDFQGDIGVGKSWAAAYLFCQCLKTGVSGWWMPFWKLRSPFNRLSDEEQNRDVERMYNRSILVIDDIEPPWSQGQASMFAEKLEQVVRTRAHSGLPTITTTNMSEDDFRHHYPRVASVLSGKQYRVVLRGEDGRPKARAKREELMRLKEMVPID